MWTTLVSKQWKHNLHKCTTNIRNALKIQYAHDKHLNS